MPYFQRLRVARMCIVMLCAAIGLAALGFARPVAADDQTDQQQMAQTCRALAQDAIKAARSACAAAGPNSACFGHAAIQAATAGSDQPAKVEVGKTADLASLKMLTTSAPDAEAKNWGVAVLYLRADLPQGAASLRAVLFGEATLANLSDPALAKVATLPVKTFDELPVLLRAGASTNFPRAAQLLPTLEGAADGRNAKGTWVRVRLERAVGWAPVDQVRITGDVNTLPVLADTDIAPLFLYPAPMQAMTLTTPKPAKTDAKTAKLQGACAAEASSGLLIEAAQADDKTTANLLINGVNVALGKAVLLARATPKENLELMVISGGALVRAYGAEAELTAGEMLTVRLGGADGLTAVAAPRPKQSYPFAALVGAPLAALEGETPCLAGVLAANPRVAARSGPSEKEFTSLFYLQPAAVYQVEGYNTDKDGKAWWKLANPNRAEHWAEQAKVTTVGACELDAKIAKIEPGVAALGGGGGGEAGWVRARRAHHLERRGRAGSTGGRMHGRRAELLRAHGRHQPARVGPDVQGAGTQGVPAAQGARERVRLQRAERPGRREHQDRAGVQQPVQLQHDPDHRV
jgi:hypothetical protein